MVGKASKRTLLVAVRHEKKENIIMMDKDAKASIIAKYARKDGDTGSPEVQIALLTARIQELTAHLRANPKDHSTRRGLLALVANRKRLLAYLARENRAKYIEVTDALDIRRK